MVRIIITAGLIVLLAVLVAFNLRFTTSISVYGSEFNEVPVMVIALLSFALGVLYSLVLYVGRYFHRRSQQQLEQRRREVTNREQELSSRGSDAATAVPAAAPGSEAAESKGSEAPGSRTPRIGLFRRARHRG